MAFFFALAAKEVVEATAPGGALHSPRRAAMPLTAAVGGMLGPALIFVTLTIVFDRPNLERAWAVPTATDIAFSYLAARIVFGAKHPVIPFLLLLAIADDALGLLIIAAFYPTGPVRLPEFTMLVGAGMVLAWGLRKRRIRSFWPYLLAGAVSWMGFYHGGLHPALALVPIIPFFPHAARDRGLFVDAPHAHDTLSEFEHRFKWPVEGMLFSFGLVNAGVAIGNAGAGTWFVLASIIAGKPLGILAATAISAAAGLRLPKAVTWKDMIVMGIVAGIGFTVALFFATAAFPYGRLLDETKLGALFSFGAFFIGLAAARLLKVGRSALKVVLLAVTLAGTIACGGKGTSSPTSPGPTPQPNSNVQYTAIGASDAIGFGSSVVCIPFVECPNGRGYVQVATRDLKARGFDVTLTNLGFPAHVLSRRLQDLGTRYGRTMTGNMLEMQAPVVASSTTLVTIFTGANDVDTIVAALGGGAGGSDQTAYIESQIDAFGQDFATLLNMVRDRAPSARIVVLNLPNMAGMPRNVSASLLKRRAEQMLSVGINTRVINPKASSGVLVVDLMCDPRSYQSATYSSDGFHPGDFGYSWIAAEVVAAATTAYRAPASSCSQTALVQ